MPWSFQADTPIYTQLVARLQEQIVSGAYPPGSKLPGVRQHGLSQDLPGGHRRGA